MSRPPIPGKKHGEFSVFTVFFGGCLLPRTLLGWDWKSQSLASSCEPGQRSWPTRTARCELRFLNIYIPTISEDGLSSKEQTSRSEFWKMTFLNHLRMTFWIHLFFLGCFIACESPFNKSWSRKKSVRHATKHSSLGSQFSGWSWSTFGIAAIHI